MPRKRSDCSRRTQVNVRLTQSDRLRVQRAAAGNGYTSMSAFVRDAVIEVASDFEEGFTLNRPTYRKKSSTSNQPGS